MNDDFNNIDFSKIERINYEVKINNITLTHFYQDLGEKYAGKPIKTSIKLEKVNNIWKEIIIHYYLDFQNLETIKENITEIENIKIAEFIQKLEKYNLKDYKNNYYTQDPEENSEYWQIEYNDKFKITGTYDSQIDILILLINFLEFSKIKKFESEKIKMKLEEINKGDLV